MFSLFKSPKSHFIIYVPVLLIVVDGFIFSVISIRNLNKKPVEIKVEQVVSSPTESPFAKKLLPIYSDPTSLVIENTNIKAVFIPLGLDLNGALETPKDWSVIGWYSESAKPGEQGNIIIDGHYDDSRGRPAAFWQLKNVKVGDKVSVKDTFGKVYNYKVTDTFFISINDPKRLEIFDSPTDGTAIMTLITCGGVWIPGKSTYAERLVVKAELINTNN